MMMFLAGSGIPALAQLHIPLMLIRGQFLLTRQMWLFMSANLNPRPAPPSPHPTVYFCSEGKYW